MTAVNVDLLRTLEQISSRVNGALEQWLPGDQPMICAQLNEAVRYSALAGGKRIRPALCIMVAEGLGIDSPASLRAGCAYELIHAYSLIHDDLPAMDNDDFRRGKPTSHKVFGEATAILAGDSLLTMAFEWLVSLTDFEVSPEKIIKIINLASHAAGYRGMIGGQMLDIKHEKQKIDLVTLETIHRQKTGALIVAPIQTGAILADACPEDFAILSGYGQRIGLLFQVVDDILDVEGDARKLGKTTGRDAELGKSTYPALLGLTEAKEYARQLRDAALTDISRLSRPVRVLELMADYIFYRQS